MLKDLFQTVMLVSYSKFWGASLLSSRIRAPPAQPSARFTSLSNSPGGVDKLDTTPAGRIPRRWLNIQKTLNSVDSSRCRWIEEVNIPKNETSFFGESLQSWFSPLTRPTDLFGYISWAIYSFQWIVKSPPLSHQPSKPLLKHTPSTTYLSFFWLCSPLCLSVPCNPHLPPLPRISTCEKRLHKAPPGPSTRAPKGAPCSTTCRPIQVSQGAAPERRRALATCGHTQRRVKLECHLPGSRQMKVIYIYIYLHWYAYIYIY